ncbi:MAG TPA: copper resistance protein CopC [Jatrophihabitantaceae bacterium]
MTTAWTSARSSSCAVRARRIKRLGLALAVFAVALPLALTARADAHAVLESSSPAAGEVVPAGRATSVVELRFDEPVEVSLGSMRVLAATGRRVDLGRVYHAGGAASRAAVGLRSGLPEGSYLVLWRVVSADSHPVAGSFTFSLGHVGPVATGAADSSGRGVPVALGVDRFVGYAGLVMLLGGVVFLLVCWPAGWAVTRARVVLWFGLGAAAASTLAGLVLQGAADVGSGLSGLTDLAPVRALLSTRFGHAHLIRLALLAAIAVTLWALRARRPGRLPAGLLLAGLAGVVCTVAVEGHAATGVWPTARVPLDVAHVAAACVWLGGLAMLSMAALPAARRSITPAPMAAVEARVAVSVGAPGAVGTPELGKLASSRAAENPGWAVKVAVQRFSALALSCVLALVASGLLAAWRQVGELDAITSTHYGQLLLVKAGLLGVVLCFAAISRRQVRAGTTRSFDAAGLSARWSVLARSVRAEAALAAVVLAVTAVLVATTPARAAYRPTQLHTVAAGPLTVQLTAVPSAARSLDMHVYVFGRDGLLADVREVRAGAELPRQHLGPVSVPLLHAGSGHFLAERVLLPHSGTWTLHLTVRASEFDSYSADIQVRVR